MKKLIILIFVFLFSVSLQAQIQVRNSEADSKQPAIQKLQGGIILNLQQKKEPVKVDNKWHYIWRFKQVWIPPNVKWLDVKTFINNNVIVDSTQLAKIRIKYNKRVKYNPDRMSLRTDKDIRRAIRQLNRRLKKLEGK